MMMVILTDLVRLMFVPLLRSSFWICFYVDVPAIQLDDVPVLDM